jgi:lipopolysaccharide transport system permease protein
VAGSEATAAQGSGQRVVIERQGGWLPVNWRELWQHRELLYFLTWRDIKVRYKQTVLGAAWAVIQPFMTMVVLTVILKGLLKLDRQLMGADAARIPYPVLLYTGLLPWEFFRKAISRSGTSLVTNSALIGKVYFPRLIIPIASVGSALVDFAIAFVVLAGIMAYYGVAPGAAVGLVLPLAVATPLAALGVGCLSGALQVAYRDMRYVLGFVVSMWYFATPVFWSVQALERPWLRLVVAVNPMCGIVEAYRSALLPDRPMDWQMLGISLASALVLLVVGLYGFRRLERRFADII